MKIVSFTEACNGLKPILTNQVGDVDLSVVMQY